MLLSASFVRNNRFADILCEYSEAIFMSGHTHIGFGQSVDFIDRQYTSFGTLSANAMARSIHNSSVSQTRWYEGSSMIYTNTYENASEGYIGYIYDDNIVYEGHCFKEYTKGITLYMPSYFTDIIFPESTFIMRLSKRARGYTTI